MRVSKQFGNAIYYNFANVLFEKDFYLSGLDNFLKKNNWKRVVNCKIKYTECSHFSPFVYKHQVGFNGIASRVAGGSNNYTLLYGWMYSLEC